MLNGWKTYAGGIGLILLGLGGILTGHETLPQGAVEISGGLIAVGLRSLGGRILDILKTLGK